MGKIITIALPDIGEGVVEGEVIQWLKQVGEPLKQDEPVVLVMTDKATVELPAPFPGRLALQHKKQGEIAQKDQPLYDIELAGEGSASESKPLEKTSSEAPISQKQISSRLKETSAPSLSGQTRALAIPAVRHLAHQMGIDIEQVQGTGKQGQVTEEDLKNFCVSSKQKEEVSSLITQPDDEKVVVRGIPLLMAKKMEESKKHIPHFSFFEQVDASRLVQLRASFKREGDKQGIHVTYMPFLIRALSLTMIRFPQINSSLDMSNNILHIHHHHHIGIAMSTDLGLIVPVLKNVEKMNLNAIVYSYEELKNKALSNHLQSNDMKGGTITISNFGFSGSGGQWATPIINYPEAAILAVSRIEKQAVTKNEEIVVCEMLHLSWSFDHRIIDGDLAASVSQYFASLIHNPASLL